jgi:hypothetical protein
VKTQRKLLAIASPPIALIAASPALSQAVTDPTKPPAPTPPTANQPSQAQPSPLTFSAAYTADVLDDLTGGAKPGGAYVHIIKLSAAYDGSTAGKEVWDCGRRSGAGSQNLASEPAKSPRKASAPRQPVAATPVNNRLSELRARWTDRDLVSGHHPGQRSSPPRQQADR